MQPPQSSALQYPLKSETGVSSWLYQKLQIVPLNVKKVESKISEIAKINFSIGMAVIMVIKFHLFLMFKVLGTLINIDTMSNTSL